MGREDGDRTYGQYCGVARALDLVGERWALLVVRELLLGPRRFTDLRAGLPGVSTNILADRLKRLERGGVVRRAVLPAPAASSVYELTPRGRELEPILLALGRWGAGALGPREEHEVLRSHWLALALKGFFHPEAARGVGAEYEVRLREGVFHLAVEDGQARAVAGPAGDPALVVEAEDDTLIGLMAGALGAEEALAAGTVRLAEGDRAGLERFVELFRFAVDTSETRKPAPEAGFQRLRG